MTIPFEWWTPKKKVKEKSSLDGDKQTRESLKPKNYPTLLVYFIFSLMSSVFFYISFSSFSTRLILLCTKTLVRLIRFPMDITSKKKARLQLLFYFIFLWLRFLLTIQSIHYCSFFSTATAAVLSVFLFTWEREKREHNGKLERKEGEKKKIVQEIYFSYSTSNKKKYHVWHPQKKSNEYGRYGTWFVSSQVSGSS